ncbi:MAG TPA: ferrous iron transport protein B, partial [Bacteroidales bacterium]|nr:ferrous iron transport protein B [Bacteroidales bacterium]
ITDKISSRYYAIKLLEKDKGIKFIVSRLANHKQIIEVAEKEIKKLEKEFLEDSETLIIDAKYGFISGALKETYVYNRHPRQRTETEVIDTFLTHKLFGIPIFIFFMWLMFQTTFSIGAYPTLWIEKLINYLQLYLNQIMNEGILKDLLINGIISGVGGVIKFLPNILILFFFIALMEQTGYMARATFIMDRIMHRIGLHGKSFIPLIMGFGCNVPAIMSTRTIESKNDRLLTILINPLMSCTARLPLYLLIAGAFFPNIAGHIVFFMYVIGILLAFVVAIIFKKTFFKGEETPFVMELPPYRMPIMRSLLKYMWHKASQYLNKIGSVILIASIIIWALGYFPKNYHIENESKIKISELIHKSQKEITNTKKLQNIENIIINTKQKIIQIEKKSKADKLSESYIGKLGKFIEPIMKPLGFDWKMSVSIIAGIPAKEIIVSTMNILYQLNDETYNYSLPKQLKLEKNQQGQFVYSKLVAFSYMLFVLIYFPCIATIITISKETGSWKWGIFTIIYTTLLAWIISFTVYQISTVIT